MLYGLTYAGVPFCLDASKVVRLKMDTGEPSSEACARAPLKYQPLEDLVDEIDRIWPFQYLQDISGPLPYQGRDLGAFSFPWQSSIQPGPQVRIGDWYYPCHASRFSIFRGLVTSLQAKAMLQAVQPQQGAQGQQAATFLMFNNPEGPVANNSAAFTLSTLMYMLPPRCIGETAGPYEGLYLITLVDERYYWQTSPATLRVDQDTTWDDLILQAVENLRPAFGPLDLSYSPIDPAYSQPEPDSQLWTNQQPAACLLDAIAANIGRVVVRNLDGSYELLTHEESAARALLNRGLVQQVVRTAGGDLFSRLPSLKIGDLFQAKNSVVPTNILFTFPYYVQGDAPVPHFLNTRYKNQRPTSWYEESYGEVLTLTVPITSGGVNVSGLIGTSDNTIHTTAKALIPDEETASPDNLSGLTALAMRLAKDQYDQTALVALDETYPGSVNWSPEGLHDIIWRWSARAKGATTRVMKTTWASSLKETQHAAPALEGATIVPKGVGGPSVNQTVRDSFSGQVATSLCPLRPMTAVDTRAQLFSISFLPTAYRWRGQIDDEIILFEGTSGGQVSGRSICSELESLSYPVDVVYRGVDNTIPAYHSGGVPVRQIVPNVNYGTNLVTYEKGEFVYPDYQTSGGISAALKVPQTQTVKNLTSSSGAMQGLYKGQVEPFVPSEGDYEALEGAYLKERNDGDLVDGKRYDGQFVGFSDDLDGTGTRPIYLVNEDAENQECGPLYFDETDVRCETGIINIYKRRVKLTFKDGCYSQNIDDWFLSKAEGCCSCGSGSGMGSGPGSRPDGCVAGTCSVCPDPPYQWDLPVKGFTGACDVLNKNWTLTYISPCTWASSASGLSTTSVLLVINSDSSVVVTFTFGSGLTTYTSTYNGVISGGDCCTVLLLTLASCGCSDQTLPAPQCPNCDTTPSTWLISGTGFTGCYAGFTGNFTLTASAQSCTWTATSGGTSILLTVSPFGLIQAVYTASDGSTVIYDARTLVEDCCEPQQMALYVETPSCGQPSYAPPLIKLLPSCTSYPLGGDCPETLTAVPSCCSVAGGGGGGGGTIQTDCCSNLLPATLYLTIEGSTLTLAYNSGTSKWEWSGSLCGVSAAFQFYCLDGLSFALDVQGPVGTSGDSTAPTTCSPLFWEDPVYNLLGTGICVPDANVMAIVTE